MRKLKCIERNLQYRVYFPKDEKERLPFVKEALKESKAEAGKALSQADEYVLVHTPKQKKDKKCDLGGTKTHLINYHLQIFNAMVMILKQHLTIWKLLELWRRAK